MGGGLAGLILERADGLPYEDLLKKMIFGPEKMDDSGIRLTPNMDKSYAVPYDLHGIQTDRWTVNGIESAGAVRSTAADMLRYSQLYFNLRYPSVRLCQTTISSPGLPETGIFWGTANSRLAGHYITHEGGTGGFTSNLLVMPENGLAVVVLMNSGEQQAGDLAEEIAFRILYGKL